MTVDKKAVILIVQVVIYSERLVDMKKWLDGRWAAGVLLVVASVLCACVWVPAFWKAICSVLKPHYFTIFDFFLYAIVCCFASIILAVFSFPLGKVFPNLFQGRSALLGLIYSALCSACGFGFFIGILLGSSEYPVQSCAASVLFLVSMVLLVVTLLLDENKLHPCGKECGARFLICILYAPGFFLSYTVIWGLLCELADKLK